MNGPLGLEPGALYRGRVRHVRTRPKAHEFSQSVVYFYLDLDRVPEAMSRSRLLGFERPAWASFRRSDFHGDAGESLAQSIREAVRAETGRRPTGAIHLLTELRTLGYAFNPVSFYYCWKSDGRGLDAIVAEITNTPWGERHTYVLDCASGVGGNGRHRWEFPKEFHISPFSRMELLHDWRFSEPGGAIDVLMANRGVESSAEFVAKLSLEKRPLNAREVRRALLRHPWPPAEAMAGIYWNALRLWWKGATFHAHPGAGDADQRRQEAA